MPESFRALPFSLRQLQYAVAVADTLSFRKAAARCYVSQPSLSAQLAQLEAVLDVQLFERDRRRVLVTAAGGEVLARARLVLREAQDLQETARRARDPFSGALRLGVIPTISPYLVPRISKAFRAAYPRLTIRWVEDKTEALVRDLEAGSLDAALLALEAEIGDVDHEVVGIDPFVLAAPTGHPLVSEARPATHKELHDATVLLLDDGHCFREQALAYCARSRTRELEFRATSLSTLTQMVASGAGVTLLPAMAVATETQRADVQTRPFAEPAPQRTVALVWRRGSSVAAALGHLAATARDAYAEPAQTGAGHAKRKRAARRTPPRA
jgi:LysR family hydrogen peroxide-inducible transcriptional activator